MNSIKNCISEKLSEDLPELDNIKFEIKGEPVEGSFTSGRLIPLTLLNYLRDKSSPRNIIIYNSELVVKNYLPFLIILCELKAAKNHLIEANKFTDIDYSQEDCQVLIRGKIRKVRSLKFSNETLTFFGSPAYKLDNLGGFDFQQYKKAKELYARIESYINLMSNYSRDLTGLFKTELIDHSTTILYFTTKTYYSKVISHASINGNKLVNFLNTGTLELKENFRIKFTGTRNSNRNELITCSLKHFDGIRQILALKELENRKIFIITDDFQEIKPSDPNFGLEDLFTFLKTQPQVLRTISLFEEKTIHSGAEILKQISPQKIYVSGEEKFQLNQGAEGKRNISCLPLKKSPLSDFVSRFRELADSFKYLIYSGYYDKGQIFKVVTTIRQCEKRITSFFNPEELEKFIRKACTDIQEVEEYFNDDFLSPYFGKVIGCYSDLLSEFQAGNGWKSSVTGEVLKKMSSSETVLIITGNNDAGDQSWLREYFRETFGTAEMEFSSPYEPTLSVQNKSFDSIFIFGFSKAANELIHSYPLGRKIFVISEEARISYIKYHFEKAAGFIFSVLKEKYPYCKPELVRGLKSEIGGDESSPEVLSEEETPVDPDTDPGYEKSLEDILREALIRSSRNPSRSQEQPEKVFVQFDDDSFLEVPFNRTFFRYSEDAQEVSEMRCSAIDLKEGDYIFQVKGQDLDQVIDSYLEKDHTLSKDLYLYKIWRDNLKNFLEREGYTYFDFTHRYMYEFVSGPQVIENWINGSTKKPQEKNFIPLLMFMQREGLLPDDISKEEIYHSTKLIKSLRSRIPAEIMQMYISELNGVEHHLEEKEAGLLNKLYKVIDIRKINLVIS